MITIGGASFSLGLLFLIAVIVVLVGFVARLIPLIAFGAGILALGLFMMLTSPAAQGMWSFTIPFGKELLIAVVAGLVVAILMGAMGG